MNQHPYLNHCHHHFQKWMQCQDHHNDLEWCLLFILCRDTSLRASITGPVDSLLSHEIMGHQQYILLTCLIVIAILFIFITISLWMRSENSRKCRDWSFRGDDAAVTWIDMTTLVNVMSFQIYYFYYEFNKVHWSFLSTSSQASKDDGQLRIVANRRQIVTTLFEQDLFLVVNCFFPDPGHFFKK